MKRKNVKEKNQKPENLEEDADIPKVNNNNNLNQTNISQLNSNDIIENIEFNSPKILEDDFFEMIQTEPIEFSRKDNSSKNDKKQNHRNPIKYKVDQIKTHTNSQQKYIFSSPQIIDSCQSQNDVPVSNIPLKKQFQWPQNSLVDKNHGQNTICDENLEIEDITNKNIESQNIPNQKTAKKAFNNQKIKKIENQSEIVDLNEKNDLIINKSTPNTKISIKQTQNPKKANNLTETDISNGIINGLNTIRQNHSLSNLIVEENLQNDLIAFLRKKKIISSDQIRKQFNPRVPHFWSRFYQGPKSKAIQNSIDLFLSHQESLNHLLSSDNTIAVAVHFTERSKDPLTRIIIIIGEIGNNISQQSISKQTARASSLLKQLNKKRKENGSPQLVFEKRLKEPIEKIKRSIKSNQRYISSEEIQSIIDLDEDFVTVINTFPKDEDTIDFMKMANEFIESEPKLMDTIYCSIGITFGDIPNTPSIYVCIILAI